MSEYDNTNRGALFRKRTNSARPSHQTRYPYRIFLQPSTQRSGSTTLGTFTTETGRCRLPMEASQSQNSSADPQRFERFDQSGLQTNFH